MKQWQFSFLKTRGGEAILEIQRGKVLCEASAIKKEELENQKFLEIKKLFPAAENWRTREPNRRKTSLST